jgi:hypothetical protein
MCIFITDIFIGHHTWSFIDTNGFLAFSVLRRTVFLELKVPGSKQCLKSTVLIPENVTGIFLYTCPQNVGVSHSLENTVFFSDDVMFKYVLSQVILFYSILPVFNDQWEGNIA